MTATVEAPVVLSGERRFGDFSGKHSHVVGVVEEIAVELSVGLLG
jgi:hypothetical protein